MCLRSALPAVARSRRQARNRQNSAIQARKKQRMKKIKTKPRVRYHPSKQGPAQGRGKKVEAYEDETVAEDTYDEDEEYRISTAEYFDAIVKAGVPGPLPLPTVSTPVAEKEEEDEEGDQELIPMSSSSSTTTSSWLQNLVVNPETVTDDQAAVGPPPPTSDSTESAQKGGRAVADCAPQVNRRTERFFASRRQHLCRRFKFHFERARECKHRARRAAVKCPCPGDFEHVGRRSVGLRRRRSRRRSRRRIRHQVHGAGEGSKRQRKMAFPGRHGLQGKIPGNIAADGPQTLRVLRPSDPTKPSRTVF
ncbi:hypothetical protein L596_002431 [Steinernema carpocapsae]|uniref:Uncharacterized protein n=1 Tax=Steinernema carpocapsae TaxID=34508 RepID=A0A4U8URZ9_STECR|nr:hypothetical protein L596_002431 [Steinernema carpocapsae]